MHRDIVTLLDMNSREARRAAFENRGEAAAPASYRQLPIPIYSMAAVKNTAGTGASQATRPSQAPPAGVRQRLSENGPYRHQ